MQHIMAFTMYTIRSPWQLLKGVIPYYYITLAPPPAPPPRNAIGHFPLSGPPTVRTLNIVWSKRRVIWKEATGISPPAPRLPKNLPLYRQNFTPPPQGSFLLQGWVAYMQWWWWWQLNGRSLVLILVDDIVLFIATCHGQRPIVCPIILYGLFCYCNTDPDLGNTATAYQHSLWPVRDDRQLIHNVWHSVATSLTTAQ